MTLGPERWCLLVGDVEIQGPIKDRRRGGWFGIPPGDGDERSARRSGSALLCETNKELAVSTDIPGTTLLDPKVSVSEGNGWLPRRLERSPG